MTLALDRRAAHWATQPAVIDHTTETTYSYADLNRRADAVSEALDHYGVGDGDAVAVLSRNRPELLAMLFGARKAGAVLAPLSHRLDPGTIATLLDRIDPRLVCCESQFDELLPDEQNRERLDGIGNPEEWLDSTAEQTSTTVVGHATQHRDSERPLLYLHTGGTTGTPKIVVLTERQVEWNCITEAAAWGLGNDDVSPVLLPLFHTGGWNLLCLPTLYAGGTVVLHREFDPGTAIESIERHGGTHVFAVAAIFDAIAAHPRFEAADFSTVEWWMSGGGPTPESLMERYRNQGQQFTQGYGLTEGGPNNLYCSPARPDHEKKSQTVGRPFPDCDVRIVDEAGDPVGVGEVGELELAGPVTADEYLHTQDGTFDGEWVSTGDLARRDEDGDIEITGRVDNRFVSGGENVSPEAIEATLEGHPDVDAVAVIGIDHDRWGTVPKAIVVGDTTTAELEPFAAEQLADFEQPHEYVVVDTLPQTGPGKLDRDALRAEYGGDKR